MKKFGLAIAFVIAFAFAFVPAPAAEAWYGITFRVNPGYAGPFDCAFTGPASLECVDVTTNEEFECQLFVADSGDIQWSCKEASDPSPLPVYTHGGFQVRAALENARQDPRATGHVEINNGVDPYLSIASPDPATGRSRCKAFVRLSVPGTGGFGSLSAGGNVVSVQWGDGTHTRYTIPEGDGYFEIDLGEHRYATPGSYHIKVNDVRNGGTSQMWHDYFPPGPPMDDTTH